MNAPGKETLVDADAAQAAAGEGALWYKDAVIYQLHIKAFFDANDDGYGDFKGLAGFAGRDKLGVLVVTSGAFSLVGIPMLSFRCVVDMNCWTGRYSFSRL